ncbi:hypothetical protein CKAH01_02410 [Colletotrichum kahawae]|uniref:Uncharacterized protein n=1 Tax=Colletotrichum kahawae TaxID=34407 RepID=A0AAD9Y118_COLKA|nr:hypothetical protein CKAH01_02410 [Colletotrichum kahawae]
MPGSHLDMASNDDMLLSAFDLTILPTIGKSMEYSPAEAPGCSSAPAPIGHVLRPMGAGKTATGSVEPQ